MILFYAEELAANLWAMVRNYVLAVGQKNTGQFCLGERRQPSLIIFGSSCRTNEMLTKLEMLRRCPQKGTTRSGGRWRADGEQQRSEQKSSAAPEIFRVVSDSAETVGMAVTLYLWPV